ncbi:hypothetical protein M2302_003336 [Micromonospora sp. A200]|nr:hypothetical protein [Micromonospora sp. A200]
MVPMDDGPITPALVLWTAKRVITAHREQPSEHRATGRCGQCRDDGCDMLTWARGVVRAHRRAGNPLGPIEGAAVGTTLRSMNST